MGSNLYGGYFLKYIYMGGASSKAAIGEVQDLIEEGFKTDKDTLSQIELIIKTKIKNDINNTAENGDGIFAPVIIFYMENLDKTEYMTKVCNILLNNGANPSYGNISIANSAGRLFRASALTASKMNNLNAFIELCKSFAFNNPTNKISKDIKDKLYELNLNSRSNRNSSISVGGRYRKRQQTRRSRKLRR